MLPISETIDVPHLGGITVHYGLGAPLDNAKPSVLLIPGFLTGAELFETQLSDSELIDKFNLVAVDPLGHGQTKTRSSHWTYWDNAVMMIQLMDALAIQGWWIVGIAQGGWIAPRIAL